jgi:hypothetical protein
MSLYLPQGYKLSIYYLTVNYVAVFNWDCDFREGILKSFPTYSFEHFPVLVAIP